MYKHRLVAPFWQDVSSSLIGVILQQCVDKTKPLLRAFLEAPMWEPPLQNKKMKQLFEEYSGLIVQRGAHSKRWWSWPCCWAGSAQSRLLHRDPQVRQAWEWNKTHHELIPLIHSCVALVLYTNQYVEHTKDLLRLFAWRSTSIFGHCSWKYNCEARWKFCCNYTSTPNFWLCILT